MGVYGTRDGIFTVKKLSIQDKMPIAYSIPLTATVATGGIAPGFDNNTATAAVTNTGITAQPPYPLNIGVTTNTSPEYNDTAYVRVTGYDNLGNLRYEDVEISSTVASTAYTNYSYAYITSLQGVDSSGAVSTSATDDIGIGYGNQVGLPTPIASSADLLGYTISTAHATTHPTVDITYNQVTVSGTATARKPIHILYMSKLQER